MTDVKFNALMWVYDVYHLSRIRRGLWSANLSSMVRAVNLMRKANGEARLH